MLGLLSRMGVSIRKSLVARVKMPWVSTRGMMILVALAAFLMGAFLRLPRSLALYDRYQSEASLELSSLADQRLFETRAQAYNADLEATRQLFGIDDVTERYFLARADLAEAEANLHANAADYHSRLKSTYRRAALLYWESIAPDPPEPGDPLIRRVTDPRLHKAHEVRGERGKAIAFAPDGLTLAIGCTNHRLRFLDPHSGSVRRTLEWPEGIWFSVAFSPDGSKLAGAVADHPMTLWNCADGSPTWTRPIHERSSGPETFWATTAAAFSPDGQSIALAEVGIDDRKPRVSLGAVRLLDARTGSPRWTYPTIGSRCDSVAFTRDGSHVAVADGNVILLDARTGGLDRWLKPEIGQVISVACSPDGRELAGGGHDLADQSGELGRSIGNGRITLWDLSTGGVLRTLNGPTHSAERIAYSPDGRWIAGGGMGPHRRGRSWADGHAINTQVSEVMLWNAATGEREWVAQGDFGTVSSMAFSPDGESLVFCDNEHVEARDVKSGKLKRVYMETVYGIFINGRPIDGVKVGPAIR